MHCLRYFKSVLLLLVFIGVGSCSPNPASPPSAPLEIPSFLVFPETLEINIDTIKAEPEGSSLSTFVPSGGEFSDLITAGAAIADEINAFVDTVLNILADLEIPVSPTVTTFEREGSDSFNPLKIDFANFDLDGDGAKEGCTGCTCPTGCSGSTCSTDASEQLQPVCYRMWVDSDRDGTFEPFMGGVFTRLPIPDDPNTGEDEENAGSGEFRTQIIETQNEGSANESLYIGVAGVVYDHDDDDDPFKKTNDISLIVATFSSATDEIIESRSSHNITEQVGLEGATGESEVKKTVKVDFTDVDSEGSTFLTYIARYREDDNFWSGTVELDLSPVVTAQCADLGTGDGVEQQTCINLDIDVTGETVSPASADDALLHDDFPDTPTF